MGAGVVLSLAAQAMTWPFVGAGCDCLMPCQVRELWEVYDHDKDGFIDRAEVRQMLEDISFIKKGHRNVPEENLEEAFLSLDANHDGKVQMDEFLNYYLRTGVAVWYIV